MEIVAATDIYHELGPVRTNVDATAARHFSV